MRRCLCLGRRLQLGRRPIIHRPPALPSLLASRFPIRHASTSRAITEDEHSFIITYNDLAPSPLQSERKNNPDVWMPFLQECVRPPPKTQKPADPAGSRVSLVQHKESLDRTHALMSYLWAARTHADLSLLVYMGFTLKQWSTVHALLSNFVDTYEILKPYMIPQRPVSGLDWAANGLSLNELTNRNAESRGARVKPLPISDVTSLDDLTLQPVASGLAERFLAELLQNVGSLVLAAADHPPDESKLAMSCVYRILARLHNLGLISDRVYQYTSVDPAQLTFRPPGLHLLSSHIMTVLSDAAWLEHETALATAATEAGEDPPFLPFQVGVRELGPEIWFELILWCCVEHGFAKHGAKLVEEMSWRTDDRSWKIESWAPLARNLDAVQQTNISTEQSWRRPDHESAPEAFKGRDKPPFNGLGKRTISTEVLMSLRSGLFNKAYNGIGHHGSTPSDILRFSAPLTSLLDPLGSADELRPTNRATNGHMMQMIDSGCLRPEQDPVAFERVLRSTQNLVPPWEPNLDAAKQNMKGMTRAQLYDDSAAFTGLVEYNIRTHAHRRQAGRAFYQFAWLQNIVDASKVRHIRVFFENLSQSKSADVVFPSDSEHVNPKLHESSLPGASKATLAYLLDLASSSRAYDFGNWLLFSDDIDGPSIPQSVYGDQALAPSILRFATTSHNVKLCRQVIASLGMPLSVNILRSLVNFHIAMGQWDRTITTLNYLRDHRLKSWGFSNMTALAAKIIELNIAIKRKQANGVAIEEIEKQSLERAKDLFLRFFHGEFNTPPHLNRRVTDFQWRALRRLHQVLSTLPGPLSSLVAQTGLIKPSMSRHQFHYIPSSSFNHLLRAVVDAYGSMAGKKMWIQWCQIIPGPSGSRQKEGGVTRLLLRRERKFHGRIPVSDAKWLAEVQDKAVIPNLNTVRIIAQTAHKEFELDRAKMQQSSADIDTLSSSSSSFSTSPSSSPSPPSPSTTPSSSSSPPSAKPDKPLYTLYVPGFKYFTKNGGSPPATDAEGVLDFCMCMFLRGGMPEDQIEAEMPGHMHRMRLRGVLSGPSQAKRTRLRIREIQDDPWMESVVS